MIEREEVRSIVQEVLEEEHLHNFTKIFEKEHNLFRGTHDKMAVPPAVVENYYTQQVVDSKTHWEREGDNIYYNDGRVGVRTSAPTHLVQIDGTGLDDNAGSLLVAGGTQQFIQVDSASRARFICDAHDADASIEFQEDDVIKWTAGFDFTDNLKFKISEGVPGTNTRLEIISGGSMNVFDTASGHIQITALASGTARFIADSYTNDAYVELQDRNVLKWCAGYDRTDGSYRISQGAPGTNNRLKIASGGAITAGGTLGIGTITVIDGSSINLQEDITFTGATTENLIKMPDDLPVALDITEAGNPYIRFITTNGSEAISILQDVIVDRWLSTENNLFLGVGVGEDGNLNHTTGNTGYHNIAIGYQSLKAITTGYRNVAIGSTASTALTTGYYNVAMGMAALSSNIGGYYNMAIGGDACLGNTSGNHNVAIGKGALYVNSLGNDNTAIGTSALYSNTGSNNVAIGHQSANVKGAGDNNVLLGHQSGLGGTGAAYIGNVCVGYRTGYALTSGGENVFLGFEAGNDVSTGSTNVCIGYQAGETNLTTGSNQLWIENSNSAVPLIYGEFDNNLVRIHGTLYVEEAAGGDQIWLSHDGTDAYFKTDDGNFYFQTDEGTNAATQIIIKGKGTGAGAWSIYDTDDDSSINFDWRGDDRPAILGSGNVIDFSILPSIAGNILLWDAISSGNPSFSIHGYKAAVGVKYGAFNIGSDGVLNITAEDGAISFGDENLSTTGTISTTEIFNTAGDLKIEPDVQGDITCFEDTDVGNAVDGKSFYVHRKAAEFDKYMRIYIDQYGNPKIDILQTGGTDLYNTFIGKEAGLGNTTATLNVFVGHEAGKNTTTGGSNLFFGAEAGRDNIDGTYNTYIGAGAGKSDTDGYGNTYIGGESGRDATGDNNTCVGFQTGLSITTGGRNTFIGKGSGYANTDGIKNTAIGTEACIFNATGDHNVVIGSQAGYGVGSNNYSKNTLIGSEAKFSITTASSDVAMGYQAGYYNTTGGSGVSIGYWASAKNTTGNYNITIGREAGFGSTIAAKSNNIFIGYKSGYDVSSGGNNVCMGHLAGEDITSGGSNVVIGYMAASGQLTTGSNKLWIANSNSATPLIYGEFDNNFLKINNHIYMLERSSDPAEPAEGEMVIWMSDGTGKGDDGDILVASKAGGTTNYGTIFDHSGGASW